MASMTFAPRASAGVARGSARPSATRQTPTARLAAFNGVVSDRVACIHGNAMFQVQIKAGITLSETRNRLHGGLHITASERAYEPQAVMLCTKWICRVQQLATGSCNTVVHQDGVR